MPKPRTSNMQIDHRIEMVAPMAEFRKRLNSAGGGTKLAKELGLSKQQVSHIVRGRRGISLDVAEKLGFELVWRKRL
jgi:antitoxin component HigA of HigAB toxin-antitoxin module